jgi:TldD protein
MTLLAQAEQRLLSPGGLASGDLDRVFAQLVGPSIDAADLYFQHSRSESWMLEDGIVKEGNHSIEQGVGVRAMSGEKTGFAYSDEIVLPKLLTAAKSARAIAQSGSDRNAHALRAREARALYAPIDPVESIGNDEKITLLREVDKYTRALDPRVAQVIVSLSATLDTVLVAAMDGTLAADVRPLVRINVNVIAESNGRRESASSGGGGRYG